MRTFTIMMAVVFYGCQSDSGENPIEDSSIPDAPVDAGADIFEPDMGSDEGVEQDEGMPDMEPDMGIDAGEDAYVPACGNSIMDDGEDCEIGDNNPCDPACGSDGTQTCVDCAWSDCVASDLSCDDSDLCTENDRCDGNSCVGSPVACDTSPTPECLPDGSTVRIYWPDGTCVDGECTILSRDEACPAPENGVGICSSDVCDGFTCDDGFVACDDICSECNSGDTRLCYPACGATAIQTCIDCAWGDCVVGDLSCDDSDFCTENDRCDGDSCAGSLRTCDDPPDTECSEFNTIRTYELIGVCEDGGCSHEYADSVCPSPENGAGVCTDGACEVLCDDGYTECHGECYNLGCWTPVSMVDAPSARYWHTAVWTGSEMIIWGGSGGSRRNDGGRYDPATDTWTPIPSDEILEPRQKHTAVWTGSEMIIWGGVGAPGFLSTGWRYNSATDIWTPTSLIGAPRSRIYHTVVWTGSEMIIWGGRVEEPVDNTNTGGRYDPVADTWTSTSLEGVPSGRNGHSAVWTGSEMIIWGGASGEEEVIRYSPNTDEWSVVTYEPTLRPRDLHQSVFVNGSMLVWGGSDFREGFVSSGGSFDAIRQQWSFMSEENAPQGRRTHAMVWTGTEMIIWGGDNITAILGDGGRYNPNLDQWSGVSAIGAPSARYAHTWVWTGTEMIVWGGSNFGYRGDGGRYSPP